MFSIMRKKIFTIFCIFILLYPGNVSPLKAGEIVEGWANSLGQELWDLARTITNSVQIKGNYTSSHAQIERKKPETLLAEIVDNLTKMFKSKMDAVRCLQKDAEDTAEAYDYNETDTEFMYYSSKYSYAVNLETGQDYIPNIPDSLEDNEFMYLNMSLVEDSHFHNIEVNTSHSVVQVPTNIYDRSEKAQTFIEWSEYLDDSFLQNYNSDPSLSWQYFCSASGVLRHFPAMHWTQQTDLYDCRTQSWFIEATTCSKDVVILFDNSGSMTGMWNTLARATVSKLLDTFSNNDFINILSYSDDTALVVPCFENLVQATPENIDVFKDYLSRLEPDGYVNLGIAMKEAFKILNASRQDNECGAEGMGCNQAIMVITDGVPNNVTEVFQAYNWLNDTDTNETNIPVRVFTYLIGREVSHVDEIIWMACLNRGYFAHIKSLDEVREKVLKYIPVIARPLVLQAKEHPTSWTHAYIADDSFEDKTTDLTSYRLVTYVAIPVYDRKANSNNETVMAELLGVASTDVPIDDIAQLTSPYKIGVNGYPFVVTNNGYILMHPNLRPVYEGRVNKNYNSMDLSEVEFLDDQQGPRVLNDKILELRWALTNHSKGSILGLPIKHFYDDMKRVFKEKYDYYYAPLPGTPFSLGIALPQSHGYYWLKVHDEIDKLQHLKKNISSYFNGTNWKIHSKWVYCKYHYLEGHEFETPEEELIHFIKKITEEKNFSWPPSQYGEADFTPDEVDDEEVECGRKAHADDDYYCDEELMQRLVFDAKIIDEAFIPMDLNKTLVDMYRATLKYVATMSGLTRWEYIYGEDNDTVIDFGDIHSKAIDETWYKSAVLQHLSDPESFVYSMSEDNKPGQPRMIMGSHAIFPRDAGHEAPGCVVGFKFRHSRLNDRFKNLINMNISDCEDCSENAWNEDMTDCYVIDQNGYIMLSKNSKQIGKFFGEIEGSVMEAMLQNNTFERTTVYDYQAVCAREVNISGASSLLSPIYYIGWFIQWIFNTSFYLIMETNLNQIWNDLRVFGSSYDDDYYDEEVIRTTAATITTSPKPTRKLRKGQKKEEEDYFRELAERPPVFINVSYSCDLQATLYLLNQTKFIKRQGYSGEEKSECSKPYYARRIPHSNLLFVVVMANTASCDKTLLAAKQEISYNVSKPPCHKLELNHLPRRKLSGCFTEDPMEDEINFCGDASLVSINIFLLFIVIILLRLCKRSI